MPDIHSAGVAFLWKLTSRAYAGQDVEGNDIFRLGDVVPNDSPGTYYADLHPCPAACRDSKPDEWTVYSEVDPLSHCPEPMIFDLAINNPLDAPDANRKRDVGECLSVSVIETEVSLQFGQQGAASQSDTAVVALEHLQLFMEDKPHCDNPVLLAYSIEQLRACTSALPLEETLSPPCSIEATLVQLCGKDRNAHHVHGVVIDTTSNVTAVQKLLSTWSKAECAADVGESTEWDGIPGTEVDRDLGRSSGPDKIKRAPTEFDLTRLQPRADCTVEKGIDGDNCETLAARCGITNPDLIEYNGDPNLCMPGRIIAG
ncbi:hypothetical protein BJX65DRAFT_302609 [Aspergillus insuetus]